MYSTKEFKVKKILIEDQCLFVYLFILIILYINFNKED